MGNVAKHQFLSELSDRYGRIHRLGSSLSLFDVGDGAARVYVRYSKVHRKNRTFYGLREEDLHELEGHPAVICFLWEGQSDPLFVEYSDYEEVFRLISPARDRQYKVQVFLREEGTELYIASAGRFNVESSFGWERIDRMIDRSRQQQIPDLTHAQVQALLASIGSVKGYGIWIPVRDRQKLDWGAAGRVPCDATIPNEFERVKEIISEIDVIWITRDAGRLRGLFEVEHSTPVYSALLRFNDVHLTYPTSNVGYNVVSYDERKELFVRQLNRPTFRASSLSEHCSFLKYWDVFSWHQRVHAENEDP